MRHIRSCVWNRAAFVSAVLVAMVWLNSVQAATGDPPGESTRPLTTDEASCQQAPTPRCMLDLARVYIESAPESRENFLFRFQIYVELIRSYSMIGEMGIATRLLDDLDSRLLTQAAGDSRTMANLRQASRPFREYLAAVEDDAVLQQLLASGANRNPDLFLSIMSLARLIRDDAEGVLRIIDRIPSERRHRYLPGLAVMIAPTQHAILRDGMIERLEQVESAQGAILPELHYALAYLHAVKGNHDAAAAAFAAGDDVQQSRRTATLRPIALIAVGRHSEAFVDLDRHPALPRSQLLAPLAIAATATSNRAALDEIERLRPPIPDRRTPDLVDIALCRVAEYFESVYRIGQPEARIAPLIQGAYFLQLRRLAKAPGC